MVAVRTLSAAGRIRVTAIHTATLVRKARGKNDLRQRRAPQTGCTHTGHTCKDTARDHRFGSYDRYNNNRADSECRSVLLVPKLCITRCVSWLPRADRPPESTGT